MPGAAPLSYLIDGDGKWCYYAGGFATRREAGALTEDAAREAFIADVAEDTAELGRLGINTELLPLLVDSLFYTL